MKAKYFVMIFGAIAFLFSFGGTGGGVSHIAHLGGMVIGYIYLRSKSRASYPTMSRRRTRSSESHRLGTRMVQRVEKYRARRKFEVYMKNRDRDRDRFVH